MSRVNVEANDSGKKLKNLCDWKIYENSCFEMIELRYNLLIDTFWAQEISYNFDHIP